MKVKIDIDTKTFVRFGLIALAFVVAIAAVYHVRSALITIGIALFLTLALNPPVSWIAHRLPGKSDNRVGATAIAYLLVLLVLGGLLVTIVPPVVEQSSKFANTVPGLIDQAGNQRQVFDDFIDRYGLQPQVDAAIENAKNQASSAAANIGNLLVSGASATFSGAATLVFVLVLTFLMLVEGPSWMQKIWGLYEDSTKLERHRNLIDKMYRVVTGYVNGQILIASIAAICTLVTVLILSAIFPLPANLALPLATIVFLTGMVPMIGATVGAIIVTLILLLNSTGAALIFLAYFIVYQQIENNFIAPTIQSKRVELSALAVLTAILIGVSLFGLLGGLISIPIAGCIRVLLLDYLDHARKQRAKSKKPQTKLTAKTKEA
jgi:predicted PurR-regulated permease PerM